MRRKNERIYNNLKKVLESEDLSKLSKESYEFLHLHCGYIPMFHKYGFIQSWKDDLSSFVNAFIENYEWLVRHNYIDNPNRFLFDRNTPDFHKNELMKDLYVLFIQNRDRIEHNENAKKQKEDIQEIVNLMDKHGIKIIQKENGKYLVVNAWYFAAERKEALK